jgi:hypothetical protein
MAGCYVKCNEFSASHISSKFLTSLGNCRFQTFAVLRILYMFFWVFPGRHIVVVVGRRFGTLCQFHLPRLDVDCEV